MGREKAGWTKGGGEKGEGKRNFGSGWRKEVKKICNGDMQLGTPLSGRSNSSITVRHKKKYFLVEKKHFILLHYL